jgi:phosphoesterase RecJ-like protein
MKDFQDIHGLLLQPKKIFITTHHKPDADAMGSSLALAKYLESEGHEVLVVTPTDYPSNLFWMYGNDKVIQFPDSKDQALEWLSDSTVIFCLDLNAVSRMNELGRFVVDAKNHASIVMIDHHTFPEDFAHFTFWDETASSCAELIYRLIVQRGDQNKIDRAMADCMYAGIMTDTGGFRHSNTSAEVHRIIADLMSKGASNVDIHSLLFDNNTIDRLRFTGYCLYEKLAYLPELNISYMAISFQELERFNIKTGDTEGLVSYTLSLEGVKLGALFIDRGPLVKISFRSVGNFPANELAGHFNGGGHFNAAGGSSTETLDETVQRFFAILEKYKPLLV